MLHAVAGFRGTQAGINHFVGKMHIILHKGAMPHARGGKRLEKALSYVGREGGANRHVCVAGGGEAMVTNRCALNRNDVNKATRCLAVPK